MADGKVRNRAYAEQGRDYSGLTFGRIAPTDVDGFLEFGDSLYVFMEFKYGDSQMGLGQRMAFERLTDRLNKTGDVAVTLVGRHFTPPEDQIDTAACTLIEYRADGRWRRPQATWTIRQAVDKLRERESIPWLCDEPPVHQAALDFGAYEESESEGTALRIFSFTKRGGAA